ncbi:MAG: hypothetical protein ABWX74_13865 [Aeromicrobium sp.]
MTKESIGMLLGAVGGVAVLIAGIKLFVIGYYPDELVLFVVIGAVGAGLCWTGSRIYQTAKQEG